MRFSVIIVAYHSSDSLGPCICALERSTRVPDEIIVVDNGQTLFNLEGTRVQWHTMPENIGFARAVNSGVQMSSGDIILLLNPDTEVDGHAIEHACKALLRNSQPTIVGGISTYADGSIHPLYKSQYLTPVRFLVFSVGLTSFSRRVDQAVPLRSEEYLTGCFMLMHRSTWERLGGFDDRFFVYFEDADLCLRATQTGVSLCLADKARYRHTGGWLPRADVWKINCFAQSADHFVRKHWRFPAREFGRLCIGLWWIRRCLVALLLVVLSPNIQKPVDEASN